MTARRMCILLALASFACDAIYYGEPRSCRAIKERQPEAADGDYIVDFDGDGPQAPRAVFCDMSRDGGGWTLITPDLVASTFGENVSVSATADAHGGIALSVVPLIAGCTAGDDVPHGQHQILFDEPSDWTHVRASYVFSGVSDCWSIFGDHRYTQRLAPNVIPFDLAVDVIREEVRMGGSAGDRYADGVDGRNWQCDALAPGNFWGRASGRAPRSATAILRRDAADQPAGLATGADCTNVAPDTYWGYSSVFVR